MNWWVVYGVCISLASAVSVLIMVRTLRMMRKACANLSIVVRNMVVAASNMWDELTPEQIRALHPHTVEVGNGLPPWREIREAMERHEA